MSEDRSDMFVLFSFVWGVSELFHQAVFADAWLHVGWPYISGWVLTGAALLLVQKPSSPFRLAFLALMDVIWYAQQLPYVPNHVFFNMLVNLTIVLSLAGPLLRHAPGSAQFDRGALLDRFAGPVRFELIALYAFAALAKLNYDFMNPRVSCGAVMFRQTLDRIGVPVEIPFLATTSIWATILLELLVPALLVARKTRVAGIVVGAIFHLLLSLHTEPGIYSFSAMCLALYVLFAPNSLASELKAWRRRLKLPAAGVTVAILAAFAVGVRSLGVARAFFVLWLIWGVSLLAVFCGFLIAQRTTPPREQVPVRRRASLVAWLVPVVVVANGLNPYLGLRTETSFAMFSNLRTEGGRTNHLFMPLSWHVASWQDDLVEIVDSSNQDLRSARDEDVLLPYFLFRRVTSSAKDPFWVRYRRGNETRSLDSLRDPDHELLRHESWLSYKWLSFRPVDREGPTRCRH